MMSQLLLICKLFCSQNNQGNRFWSLGITRIRFGADNEGLISTYGTTEDKQQLVSTKRLSIYHSLD